MDNLERQMNIKWLNGYYLTLKYNVLILYIGLSMNIES